MSDEMSISEVAALKGISRAAVHKAIKEGRLTARWQTGEVKAVWKIDRPGAQPSRGTWRIRLEDANVWEPTLSPVERGKRGVEARRNMKDENNEA